MSIQLRKIKEEDLEMLRIWRMSPEVTKYLYTDPVITEADQIKWYERIKNDESLRYWIINYNGNDIGLLSLTGIDKVNSRCEWFFFIAETAYRGMGLGRALSYNIFDYVFNILGFNRLSCEIFLTSQHLIKMCTELGYSIEGTRREFIRKGDKFYDVLELSILRSDWKVLSDKVVYEKANIEEVNYNQEASPRKYVLKRIVFITGSTRGIGKQIALDFLKNGYYVILNNKNRHDNIFQIIPELENYQDSYDYYPFDITNRTEVTEAFSEIFSRYRSIDILVNNAGICQDRTIFKMDDESWDSVIAVDLNGTYNVTKAVFPHMQSNRFGRIINISSIIGQKGNYGQTNYAAAKAGVIGFTKSLAQEGIKYGITVNAVAPGYIQTDILDAVSASALERIKSTIPAGDFGTPGDVANAVIFLAKEESGYIVGSTITVNGGQYFC
jgi:UDP-4-amino-4,6-dideoxy-N-acetyl-beta-L-altrosamine N-acetyltransferase